MRRLWAVPNDSKHTEGNFSPISTDLLCLRVAQIPISPDLVIFVVTTDDRQMTDKTNCFTLAHAHGVKMKGNASGLDGTMATCVKAAYLTTFFWNCRKMFGKACVQKIVIHKFHNMPVSRFTVADILNC